MWKMPCPGCGQANDEGTRFCSRCGQSLEASARCPSCNHAQPVGNQFCMSCGAKMIGARWAPVEDGGAVVEGIWERSAGEFIRRVDPEDCRTFLGNRVVRIPPGTVGAVLVDGLVDRILPPGEQVSVSLLERIANFFTGRDDRTAFYLVDQRPVPVPFAVHTRPGSDGSSAETQVVVSFSLQRGDKQGVASFIANVLGHRPVFTARDLYDLLRPEVTSLASQALERLSTTGAFTYEVAESAIRRELEQRLSRYGLGLAVTVAPLTRTSSLSFHLGTGEAPAERPCSKCGAQLQSSMRFCDRCGERQPAVMSAERACGKCGARVPGNDGFCSACGTACEKSALTAAPLFTSDGARVEIDLVVRVQGQHHDFAPERITEALVAVVAAHLRSVTFAQLASAGGFGAAEQAVRGAVEPALASFGLSLVAVAVVDVRDKRGQWILGARADLARAHDEVLLGREWLKQRADEIDLEEHTFAQKLEAQRVERETKLAELRDELDGRRRREALETDSAFARDQAALDDRQRREAIASGQAALDAAGAERGADRDKRVAVAARSAARDAQAAQREDELTALRHDQTVARAGMALGAEARRQEADLASEAAQRQADDAAYAARGRQDAAFEDHARRAKLDDEQKDAEQARQLEKLTKMAELDRQMAEQEETHKRALRDSLKGMSEREMIAVQATELAKTEGGGAAWAAALAGDEARRQAEGHAAQVQEVMKQQLDRMEHLTTAALASAAQRPPAEQVYEKSMDAMSRVAASRAAPPPPIVAAAPVVAAAAPGVACKNGECTAVLAPGTRFCGSCGSPQ